MRVLRGRNGLGIWIAALGMLAGAPVAMGDVIVENLYASAVEGFTGWVDVNNIIGNTDTTCAYKVCTDGYFARVTDFDDFDGTGKTITGVRHGVDLVMESGTQTIRKSIAVGGVQQTIFPLATTTRQIHWQNVNAPTGGWTEAAIDGLGLAIVKADKSGTGWTGNTVRQYRSIVEVTWTPEPTSALLFVGALGFGCLRRRKRI